jgi:hypothetical protein
VQITTLSNIAADRLQRLLAEHTADLDVGAHGRHFNGTVLRYADDEIGIDTAVVPVRHLDLDQDVLAVALKNQLFHLVVDRAVDLHPILRPANHLDIARGVVNLDVTVACRIDGLVNALVRDCRSTRQRRRQYDCQSGRHSLSHVAHL